MTVGAMAVAGIWSSGATAATSTAGKPAVPDRDEISTVTLISGDRVRLTTRAGGVRSVVPIPGPGRSKVVFSIRQRGRDVEVVPSDAAPLLLTGRLDRRLFEVARLAAAGYDDARTKRIPLILQYAPGRSGFAAVPRGTTIGRPLPSVRSAAVSEPKGEAVSFWRWLVGQAAAAPGTGPSIRGGALAGDVEKVWLDGPVRATLDRSVPQTGAPKAWQLGYTGKGVQVAVLDSGVDRDHPDLKGAVVAERDFIGSPSGADDRFGHGTHVASTITGSGAASNGRYKGMAPDATLLNGKVLNDEGSGTESSVIAGMEWAADQGARIANMSIGSSFATDGTDPVSLALNRITAQKGTLFVVAAGNNGPYEESITSPGSADAALTVGAVGSTGTTAEFSSRGPRVTDFALKPDLAAPGVGIVAARAGGSFPEEPVGASYARMSGTSMATPHVAGGAALLAQLRPTWKAAELKAMLVGSAKPKAGEGVFDQGAGQLDAARALTQRVSADRSSVSLYLKWPHTAKTSRVVTYRNTTAAAVTLTLRVSAADGSGDPAPAGVVTLDKKTLTIPARSTAPVTLTVNPRMGMAGTVYHGRITASGGAVAVQTPWTAYVEEEAYDLTIKATDRDGQLIDRLDQAFLAQPVVADPTSGEVFWLRPVKGGLGVRLPRGHYTFGEIIVTEHGIKPPSFTHLSRPNFTLTGNLTLTLDARAAKLVQARVEAPDASTVVTTFGTVELVGGFPWTTLVNLPGTQRYPTYALPTAAVTDRTYMFALYKALDSGRGTYDLVLGQQGRVPANPAYSVRDADLVRLDSRFDAGGVGLDVEGVWFRQAELPRGVTTGLGWFYTTPLPSRRTRLFSAEFGSGTGPGEPLIWSDTLDVRSNISRTWFTEFHDPATYHPGQRVSRTWNPAAFRPHGQGNRSVDGSMNFWFAPFSSSLTSGSQAVWDATGIAGKVTLRRAGKVVAESTDPFLLDAGVQPSPRSTYTLDVSAKRKVPWSTYATTVTGRWVFSSATPADEVGLVSMLNILATGAFDAHGRAPAGKPFRLDLPMLGGPETGVVRRVQLSVSYDDGKTWSAVPVSQNPTGRWSATLTHPNKPGGFVSLRMGAIDDKGNQVDVTSIRAYGLRGE